MFWPVQGIKGLLLDAVNGWGTVFNFLLNITSRAGNSNSV